MFVYLTISENTAGNVPEKQKEILLTSVKKREK